MGERRLYVTDCEGPLTRNDNAQEIAERFIPDGAEFFARLSRYDDFLADVVHKPGYNAGDTLRLLPPFLKAFAVTDEDVELSSAEGVLLVPGVDEDAAAGARAPPRLRHLDLVHTVHSRSVRQARPAARALPPHRAQPRRLDDG